MKWSFNNREKLKAAGYLLGIILVTLFISVSMKQATQDMDRTLSSVYADRLQPAVDLVYISESLHAKQFLLEDKLRSTLHVQPAELLTQLNQHNGAIRKRIEQLEKTKLTADERHWLSRFEQSWSKGIEQEQIILQLIKSNQQEMALQLASGAGTSLFRQGVQSLHMLAQIQSDTGHKAVEGAHQIAAGVFLDVTLLQAISIIISLLALVLIHNAKLLGPGVYPFHLN